MGAILVHRESTVVYKFNSPVVTYASQTSVLKTERTLVVSRGKFCEELIDQFERENCGGEERIVS